MLKLTIIPFPLLINVRVSALFSLDFQMIKATAYKSDFTSFTTAIDKV